MPNPARTVLDADAIGTEYGGDELLNRCEMTAGELTRIGMGRTLILLSRAGMLAEDQETLDFQIHTWCDGFLMGALYGKEQGHE